MTILSFILSALLLAAPDVVSFDSLVYDFGSQPRSVESLTHDFVFTNVSSRPVKVSYAVATCSCTKVSWSTEYVAPGQTGYVRALYNKELNSESFEKFISVFFDGLSKPFVLRISGSFHETEDALSKDFPVRLGPLGLSASPLNLGEVYAGDSESGYFWVANLSDEAASIEFRNLSDSLSIQPSGLRIEPQSRERFRYRVGVDTLSWGRRSYSAQPCISGKVFEDISFVLTATQSFSHLSRKEKVAGPCPMLTEPSCSFGNVKSGRSAKASFSIKNTSHTDALIVRAVFSDTPGLDVDAPGSIAPRQTAEFKVRIPSSALSRGENTIKLCVQSNSATMQILDVYISGNVE